jgi:hypothetical protein
MVELLGGRAAVRTVLGTVILVEIFGTGSYGDAQGRGRSSKVAAQDVRRILREATEELSVLDTFPD